MIELSEICDLQNGYAFRSSDYIDHSDTLNCRMSNIRPDGNFDAGYAPKYLPNGFAEKYKNFLLKEGDLVIAMTDMANDPKILGVPTIVKTNGKQMLLNQRVGKLIITKPDKVYVPYLQYSLNRKSVRRYYTKFAGGGLQLNVGKKEILSVKIPLPPLAQQKKIAAILDAADAYRQKTKALIAKYEELTQSLFLEMFGDPVRNPKGLPKTKLGELGKWQSGGTPSRSNSKYYEGNIPWLSSGELNQMYTFDSKEHITEQAIKESNTKLIEKGSILLGMYDTAALKSTINVELVTCNQAIAYCKLDEKLVNTSFVYHIIQIGKEHYRRLQRGVRQKNLNLSMVKGIEILFPPLSLQNQFAQRVQAIEAQKTQAQASLAKSEDLFNSLLQRAFKGGVA